MPRVNLVPPEERRREVRRQMVLLPVAGAIVVAGALAGSYFYFDNKLNDSEEELQSYKNKNAGQAQQVAELQKYEEVKNEEQALLGAVTNAYQARFRWSRMLDDMSFVIPDGISLIKVTGSVPGAVTGVEKNSTAKKATQRDLEFEGYTNSMPDVATFMVRLGLIPTLADVTLKLAEREAVGGPVHFVINASLKTVGETQRPAVAPTTGEAGPSPVTPTGTTTTPTSTTATSRTGTTTGR